MLSLATPAAADGSYDLGACAGYLPGSISSGGAFPWEALPFEGPAGGDCIVSGLVFEAGDTSVAELELSGPGVLSFQWHVSSIEDESWLSCELARGGQRVEVAAISGPDETWRERELFIPQGECTVRWVFTKTTSTLDFSVNEEGRLAGVSFTPMSAEPQDFEAWKSVNGVDGDGVVSPNGLRYDTCWLMGLDPSQPVPAGLNRAVPEAPGVMRYRVRYSLSATGLLATQFSGDLAGWTARGLRCEMVPGSATAETVDFDFLLPAGPGACFVRCEHAAQLSAPEGFVYVPSGRFLRSSPASELGRFAGYENFQHPVTLTRGFFLRKHETTLAEWNDTRDWARANGYPDLGFKYLGGGISDVEMGAPGGRYLLNEEGGDITDSGPSLNGEPTQPVSNVSWYETVKWLNAKSERDGLEPCYHVRLNEAAAGATVVWRNEPLEDIENDLSAIICDWDADGYRLPTEAEWEFACRGGTTGALSNGLELTYGIDQDDPLDPNVDPIAWYWQNGAASQPVGQKAPNPLGLHDMHGNIGEWCWDRFNENLITPFPAGVEQVDPRGQAGGIYRAIRGGSWRNSGRFVRSATRSRQVPTLQGGYQVGFRIARTAAE